MNQKTRRLVCKRQHSQSLFTLQRCERILLLMVVAKEFTSTVGFLTMGSFVRPQVQPRHQHLTQKLASQSRFHRQSNFEELDRFHRCNKITEFASPLHGPHIYKGRHKHTMGATLCPVLPSIRHENILTHNTQASQASCSDTMIKMAKATQLQKLNHILCTNGVCAKTLTHRLHWDHSIK